MIQEKTMKSLPAVLLAVTLLGIPQAQAAMQPAYGGQVAMAGELHVEFAVRDGGLRAWVRDHADKPVAATGKATLLVDGKKIEVALTPEGEALLADAPVKAGDKLTAILSLSAGGMTLSARFAQEAVTVPALSPQAQAGGKLYAEACAACHGAALRGSDAGPPLLHPYYAAGGGHGDDVILAAITKGAASHHWKFGDMPKPEGVKPGQEKDALAFIRHMQAANGIGALPAAAANPHAGH
jgi:mono/diheme cytochrome c family protein